jgi:enamine deaminase RidA (YjgF/YER057c/UK114 family)
MAGIVSPHAGRQRSQYVILSLTMPDNTSIEQKLKNLGIELPQAPTPMANFVPYVRTGNLLFLSGQGPRVGQNEFKKGKVGADVSTEEAYEHARLVGIQLLAAAKQALGDLGKVRRVVKLLGLVNGTPEFQNHPQVINGCSDLLVEVFGDIGRHARSAIGAGGLPNNITVEIEAIFEVE